MIEDRTRPPSPTPRDWAVFRYGLISEATRPLAHEVVSQTLARVPGPVAGNSLLADRVWFTRKSRWTRWWELVGT